MIRISYMPALRAAVSASAPAYGYALTIWTTGAVLSHAHGIPSSISAVLFLIGAVGAYALVGGLVFAGSSQRELPEPSRAAVWGALHFVSVGLAIGTASLNVHFVQSAAAWPLGGFLATTVYLLGSAVELAVAEAIRSPQASSCA